MKNKILIILTVLFLFPAFCSAADLLTVYNDAVKSDPVSIAARLQVLISKEQQQQAEASLYPQASLSGSFSGNRLSGPQINTSEYGGTSVRVNISQALWDLASWRENERWKILGEKAQMEYQQAQSELIQKVVQRYFDVLIAQDYLDLVRQNEKTIAASLEQLQALYQKQLVAVTGVYEAQARLDLAKSEEIEAEAKLATAYERLYQLIGNRVEQLAKLKDDIQFVPLQDSIEDWLALARNNNPQLLAARKQVLAAEKDVSGKSAGYYPTVSLGLSHSYQDVGYDNAPRPQTDTSTISLNFRQPIYQGGGISAKKRESMLRLELAKQGEIEITRGVEQLVREYYLNIKASTLKIKATARQIVSEKKRAESMKASFKYGSVTVNDVLNADTAFYKAQVEHQKAKYDYIVNQFNLKNVAGVLTEADLQQANRWLIP